MYPMDTLTPIFIAPQLQKIFIIPRQEGMLWPRARYGGNGQELF